MSLGNYYHHVFNWELIPNDLYSVCIQIIVIKDNLMHRHFSVFGIQYTDPKTKNCIGRWYGFGMNLFSEESREFMYEGIKKVNSITFGDLIGKIKINYHCSELAMMFSDLSYIAEKLGNKECVQKPGGVNYAPFPLHNEYTDYHLVKSYVDACGFKGGDAGRTLASIYE